MSQPTIIRQVTTEGIAGNHIHQLISVGNRVYCQSYSPIRYTTGTVLQGEQSFSSEADAIHYFDSRFTLELCFKGYDTRSIGPGNTVTDKEGNYTVVSIEKPRHSGSTGRVYVEDEDGMQQGFYPSVFDLVWKHIDLEA